MRCMNILHKFGKKNKMVKTTDYERKATIDGMTAGYEHAAQYFPEVALALSKLDINQMLSIGICITGGFSDSMAEQAENEIPW